MSGSELISSELTRSGLIRSELIRSELIRSELISELIRTNHFESISELIRTLIFNIKKPQLIFYSDFNHRFFKELIRILSLTTDLQS